MKDYSMRFNVDENIYEIVFRNQNGDIETSMGTRSQIYHLLQTYHETQDISENEILLVFMDTVIIYSALSNKENPLSWMDAIEFFA